MGTQCLSLKFLFNKFSYFSGLKLDGSKVQAVCQCEQAAVSSRKAYSNQPDPPGMQRAPAKYSMHAYPGRDSDPVVITFEKEMACPVANCLVKDAKFKNAHHFQLHWNQYHSPRARVCCLLCKQTEAVYKESMKLSWIKHHFQTAHPNVVEFAATGYETVSAPIVDPGNYRY